MPALSLSKVIDVHDFDSPDLAPYLREIHELASKRFGCADDEISPDAILWQQAMALRALDLAGAAASGRMVAGIGAASHGALVFALARRSALVFAADRYLQQSAVPGIAPSGMLIDPDSYAPAPVPRGHVLAVYSSPTRLNLPSNAFDAVFSLGLMERLGSLDDVAAAAREIGRILRPGGVASIATEFRLDGPADRRWFDDRVMLFSEQTLAQYIVKASGLKLRVPLWTNQSDATFETRHQFADFRSRGDTLEALAEKRAVTPNLVLYHDGFLFCPVALTLHKDSPAVASDEPLDPAINTRVDEENAALAVHVERLLRGSALPPHPAAGDPLLLHEIERLRAEADWLRAEYERSNRWKKWRVMRPVRFVYHRVKRWRR